MMDLDQGPVTLRESGDYEQACQFAEDTLIRSIPGQDRSADQRRLWSPGSASGPRERRPLAPKASAGRVCSCGGGRSPALMWGWSRRAMAAVVGRCYTFATWLMVVTSVGCSMVISQRESSSHE